MHSEDEDGEPAPPRPAAPAPATALREGDDYVIGADGLLVFTRAYLLRRGTCCRNGCRHCPWDFKKP